MSNISNQTWLSTSLLPKDSNISIGSSDYPLSAVYCNTLTATNLTVSNQTTVNNTDIKDPIVTLAYGNNADVINSGLIHSYVSSGSKWAGLMRYAGDGNFYLIKDTTSLPTVSTNISSLTRGDLIFNALTTSALTNQIKLGSSTTTILTAPAPSANRVYTIPDVKSDASFIMSSSDQKISGSLIFNSCSLTNTTNQLTLGSGTTTVLTAPTPSANRVYTIPDVKSDASFIMSAGNPSTGQSISGNLSINNGFVASIAGNNYTSINSGMLLSSDGNVVNQFQTTSSILKLTTNTFPTGPSNEIIDFAKTYINSYVPITATGLTLSNLTASKLVLTDASSNLVSSSIGATDLVLTSTDQTIAGSKTFSSPVISNASANQLVLGVTNTLTITAPMVSFVGARIYTIPEVGSNSSFIMNNGNQTINNTKTFSSPIVQQGVTDGSSAATGKVGEYIESVVRTANTGATGGYRDATSISLTAGDWILYHTCNFYQLTAGSGSFLVGISTTSGNSGTGLALGDNVMQETTTAIGFQSSSTVVWRRNITSTTTFYAKIHDAGLQYDTTSKLCAVRFR